MKLYLLAYVATALVFLALDVVWLGTMAKLLYRPMLGGMLRENFAVAPAMLFYALYIVGIVFFAEIPAFASGRWLTALGHGALFGLIAYATYDLTNQATLKNWPVAVTCADLAWGMVATAIAGSLGVVIARAIVRV
jgi:uncharacterized membrane protein